MNDGFDLNEIDDIASLQRRLLVLEQSADRHIPEDRSSEIADLRKAVNGLTAQLVNVDALVAKKVAAVSEQIERNAIKAVSGAVASIIREELPKAQEVANTRIDQTLGAASASAARSEAAASGAIASAVFHLRGYAHSQRKGI